MARQRYTLDNRQTGAPSMVVGYRGIDPKQYRRYFGKGILANDSFRLIFEAAALKYGLNAGFLAGITAFETGGGRSRMVRGKRNTGGITDAKTGKYRTFATLEKSIYAKAAMLKRHYVDRGFTTIERIAARYAPVGASNDPNGTNHLWPKYVASRTRNLTSDKTIPAEGMYLSQLDERKKESPPLPHRGNDRRAAMRLVRGRRLLVCSP